MPLGVVAPRCEQQLQVRALQPLAAAAEYHRRGDAESQRTSPCRGISPDLADQPEPPRQLVDRDLARDPVCDANGKMVGEVGADSRQIVPHCNRDRLQIGGRPDARDLQQVRRIDGAARDHDFARCKCPVIRPVLAKSDADATVAVQ